MKLTRSITKTIYLSGLALYVVSLFLPAYSPLGIWNESGWDALKFVLNIDFNAVKQINSIVQVLNFAVLMLSALNSVLVVILIGLFPIRRYFNNKRWFKNYCSRRNLVTSICNHNVNNGGRNRFEIRLLYMVCFNYVNLRFFSPKTIQQQINVNHLVTLLLKVHSCRVAVLLEC